MLIVLPQTFTLFHKWHTYNGQILCMVVVLHLASSEPYFSFLIFHKNNCKVCQYMFIPVKGHSCWMWCNLAWTFLHVFIAYYIYLVWTILHVFITYYLFYSSLMSGFKMYDHLHFSSFAVWMLVNIFYLSKSGLARFWIIMINFIL